MYTTAARRPKPKMSHPYSIGVSYRLASDLHMALFLSKAGQTDTPSEAWTAAWAKAADFASIPCAADPLKSIVASLLFGDAQSERNMLFLASSIGGRPQSENRADLARFALRRAEIMRTALAYELGFKCPALPETLRVSTSDL